MSITASFYRRCFNPTEIYSLVFMRIAFGAIMFWEVTRYFSHGWIERYYVQPAFFFKYYGFSLVNVWLNELIYIHFIILGILALMIMVGIFYRFAIITFLIGFTYVYLLDQANYLNHFYMVIIFNFLLCFIPAHHYLSVDAQLKPKIKYKYIPFWPILLLRTQLVIILIYAGIVKINQDWLHLEPLRTWLSGRADYFLIGHLFTQDWAIAIAAYGVIILHIIGAPLLLLKRTRIYIFILYCCFHILNACFFSIGIFPWITIAITLICFDPNWPVRVKNYITKNKHPLSESIHNKNSISLIKKRIVMSLVIIWIAVKS